MQAPTIKYGSMFIYLHANFKNGSSSGRLEHRGTKIPLVITAVTNTIIPINGALFSTAALFNTICVTDFS